MPLREIEEKFTRSELILMAWRSQEQHYNFKKRMKSHEDNYDMDDQTEGAHSGTKADRKRKTYNDGIGPERMPDEFFDEHGDFNLSKVKGEQARQYFERILRIPMPPNMVTKIGSDDTVTKEIRQAYNIRS